MSRVYLDITGRFGAAFGAVARNVIPRATDYNPYGFSTYENNNEDFEDITFRYDDKVVKFESKPFRETVRQKFHTPLTSNIGFVNDVVAPPPIIQFSRAKAHIVTSLNDGHTEVVERWNTKAWDIKMRGILVDMDNHRHPSTLKKSLRRLFEYNNVNEVSGDQFSDQNIQHLYFTNISMQGVVGYEDTIQYVLSAKSIRESNFTLLNPN